MKHLCVRLRAPRPGPAARPGWLSLALLGLACLGSAAQAEMLAAPAEVLALLNAQRAAGAVCGGERLPPAPPLSWHSAMEGAAAAHLQDVAMRPALSHVGRDGSSVGGRVWRQGYVWGGVGENVAGGHRSAADTLRLWLDSPSHCRTLMDGHYRHVAVVGRFVPGSRLGHYWVMVVARPLR